MTSVVTYQTPSGETIEICDACEARLTAARDWPRSSRGEEYCQVSYGRHDGSCAICGAGSDDDYDE